MIWLLVTCYGVFRCSFIYSAWNVIRFLICGLIVTILVGNGQYLFIYFFSPMSSNYTYVRCFMFSCRSLIIYCFLFFFFFFTFVHQVWYILLPCLTLWYFLLLCSLCYKIFFFFALDIISTEEIVFGNLLQTKITLYFMQIMN